MITQFVEKIPEGMSTPDFTRKPIALTIQEGTVNIQIMVTLAAAYATPPFYLFTPIQYSIKLET